MPLRCSAAGFGIGEEPQARFVQGRKTKKAKSSPVTARTGLRGPGGYTGTHGPYSAGGQLEQTQCAHVHSTLCAMPLGPGPQGAGANSNKHAPLISAWSAIVHSDIDHGLGVLSVLCRSPPSWTIPLRISGFPQHIVDRLLFVTCMHHAESGIVDNRGDALCFVGGHSLLFASVLMLMKTLVLPAMWCTLTGNGRTYGASFPLRQNPTLWAAR